MPDRSNGPAPPEQDTSRSVKPPMGPTSEEQAGTTLTMGETNKTVSHPAERDASEPEALSTARSTPGSDPGLGTAKRGQHILATLHRQYTRTVDHPAPRRAGSRTWGVKTTSANGAARLVPIQVEDRHRRRVTLTLAQKGRHLGSTTPPWPAGTLTPGQATPLPFSTTEN